MADLMYCLTNLLFFDIPLLYYHTNLNSSMICCIFSEDIYLYFGNSLLAFSVECINFERSSPERCLFGDFEVCILLSVITN